MPTEFSQLATQYENSLFNYYPELGVFWGKSDVAHDRFVDYSQEGIKNWQKQEDQFLLALKNIDEKDLIGKPDYYTYLLFKETLENKRDSRICREELWDVNPAFGWHNKMGIVAEKQPVGTNEYRQLALKRWRSFKTVVDNQISNLKLGLKLGFTAPKPAVKGVLTQIKIILAANIEESPFFDFAKRDGDEAFKIEVASLIDTIINPSLRDYVEYLENDYLPHTRNEIGVSALPSGEQCYLAKIKEETTLLKTPKEIHESGLHYIQKFSDEIAEIGEKRYGTKDIKVIFTKAKNESLNYFSSEKDILNYNLSALERVKTIVSNWFESMPKTEGIVKPYPAHRAKTGASGEYHPPNQDGSQPGIFYINTFEPTKRNRIDMEATLFHELIPGHHFQVALTYENNSLLPLNKYLWNAGYGEGWALYVERLADEMGLYKDDISRLGMLSNESLRAARLVVDTGIHAMHWSREQAVDYLREHTALDGDIIQGEVDRYIMLPGQATSYMLGKNEIEELRQLAKQELGDLFNIRQFHNHVLNHGSVSLPILRTIIENWITMTRVKAAI
ncbi:MAG: DUF885 domain-containing protein [Tatlockia sp.]|nr:DUF885 domain-containing protein [Tatlockia sp.]